MIIPHPCFKCKGFCFGYLHCIPGCDKLDCTTGLLLRTMRLEDARIFKGVNTMKKLMVFLLLGLLLCGCAAALPTANTVPAATGPEVHIPGETIPYHGNPDDVTCKRSYTGLRETDMVVAYAGTRFLTRDELQVWYRTAVAAHRAGQRDAHPDYDLPLDAQSCPLDDSVNSWQQYFLKQALEQWHTAAALICQSEAVPMPTEAAYQPNWASHSRYMNPMPAAKFLYGHNVYYQVNTLHQAYLDRLPQLLETLAQEEGYANPEELAQEVYGVGENQLQAFAEAYNRGYMYFTAMSYSIEPTQEELNQYHLQTGAAAGETAVNIRHALLVPQDIVQTPKKKQNSQPAEPIILEAVQIGEDGTVTCSDAPWENCEKEARTFLDGFQKSSGTEADFAAFANARSRDLGTANNGGAYLTLRRGQLLEELDSWCFDPARKPGDTTMIRTPYGIHLLYFSDWVDLGRVESREAYIRQQQRALLQSAREAYPMTVDYGAIVLYRGGSGPAADALLYPDIGHERFPEIPVYLQQDYPTTMYGNFPIRSHGCGITTMAMLASYMADDELTPPEMCARFGRYCYVTGTDGRLFSETPAGMGFYLREKTYDPRVVWAALEEGQIVISCQHRGYWTRGGHYIALERIAGEKMVQVRDSNIFNYGNLKAHLNDMHRWSSITKDGAGYWIYEDKVVTIPACSRCGDPESLVPRVLQEEYTCEKCSAALLRRNTYLS